MLLVDLGYKPTYLESWIMERYIKIGINNIEDLEEKKICAAYDIYLKKSIAAHSLILGKFNLITVKETSPAKEQREQFFHELCHILRHEGRQLMMPAAFREMQEWDANHFTRYAAIPFHLLQNFNLSDPGIIKTLSDHFKCTEKLCYDRLEKIYNNRKGGIFYEFQN